MARKKKEEDQAPSGGWLSTFADLMNLLLCFFVLLFSMSTVDADKYEQLVTSMSESINIFDGGGNAVGEGAFVSSGTDQMISVSQYFNEFEETGEDSDSKEDQSTQQDGDKKTDEQQQYSSANLTEEQIEAVEEKNYNDLKDRTEEIYKGVVESAEKKNVRDDITINMDKDYQYVQISLNGAILFDSGTAEIKKSTLPLLSKIGDVLKNYDDHMIKIEGHTDNVPISGGQYKNNMWLSTARATEVFEYFVKEKNLSPKSMEPTGRGKYDPIASNDTAKGRAQNRRVEIKIYTDN
jgi:chemotaxis protein MotB